jgi:hypothetical protein
VRIVLAGVVCAITGTAYAQAPAPPSAPAAPAPVAPPAPIAPAGPTGSAAPVAPTDPAWDAYDDAFARAVRGDRLGAHAILLGLSARWPGHPAADRASALAERLTAEPHSAGNRIARGELVFWSTVGGAFAASNVCTITGCTSDRETAAVYTISVGGALGLSLLASRNGVEQGEAQLYNSAQTWGSWNGLAINDRFAETSGQAAIALASQGLGLAAGIGLWRIWRPTQGDVALTNSFFLWSTVLTLWGHLAADQTPTLGTVAVVSDVGIVLGAALSTQIKMSRGRTLLIDAGGVLGILAGGLVAAGSNGGDSTVGIALLAGTATGLGIAAAATHDWDGPTTNVAIAPSQITTPAGHRVWGVSAGVGF